MRAPLLLLLLASGCSPAVDPSWTPRPSESACRAHAGIRRLVLEIHGLD